MDHKIASGTPVSIAAFRAAWSQMFIVGDIANVGAVENKKNMAERNLAIEPKLFSTGFRQPLFRQLLNPAFLMLDV